MTVKEKVLELAAKDFSTIIKDKLVIIDFYAEWCMPCLMMAPVIESLAEKNQKIRFAKVNVDDNPDLAQKFKISSIPCIIFFKNSKEIDRIIGSISEELLLEKIKSYSR